MSDETLPLGPWPLGVNNIDHPQSPAFQPGESGAQLRTAENVDINRSGHTRRRGGYTARLTLNRAHSLVSIGGYLLLASEGTLYRVEPRDWSMEAIALNVGDAPLTYALLGTDVLWSSEQSNGLIRQRRRAPWGLPIAPSPVTTTVPGSLRAGRYLIAATWETLDGLESGFRQPAVVQVPENGGVQVTIGAPPEAATAVNLYASEADGRELYWVKTLQVGDPLIVDQVGQSTDLCDMAGLYPPPLGQIVRTYRGYTLVASGSALYWSQPMGPHHFRRSSDVQLFSDRIVMLEPLADGFFVAVEDGPTWWVAGDDPHSWMPREVDTIPVSEGTALRMQSGQLPWLNVPDAPVVVWSSARGLAVGLPDGSVQHPTESRFATDTYEQAALLYREESGIRQIIAAGQRQTQANRLAVADEATIEVIKATRATP